jgi:hypothetical protein
LATLADRLLNAQGKPIWDLATQLRRLATELLRTNGPWLEADSISLTIHRDCDQLVQRVEAAEQADLAAQLNKEPPGAESRRGSVLERAQRVLLKWKKEGRQTTTPEEVAEEAGCSARQLYRLPDFMKALDVFNGREVRSNEQMPSGRRKSDEIAKERMRESSDDN